MIDQVYCLNFYTLIFTIIQCIHLSSYFIFSWAKGENDARKTEIANLDNFAHSENDARKNEIANLDNFAKSENDGRKQVCSNCSPDHKNCFTY